ncbi:HNH endonuclease signature motif containing protein, partial [Jiangella alkaliphila]
TCRAPGCHRAARSCDIDHIVSFAAGGATSAANCHALCETHHLLKHHAKWAVERQPDGTTRWRSPTGHHFLKPPARAG